MIGIIKEDGQLRTEAANILRVLKSLNGYATALQIALEYKQQHGDQIGKGYLDAVLKEAVTEKLVRKINADIYHLTPKGELLLEKRPTAHGGGETSKEATPEPKPNEDLACKKVTFSPHETWNVIKALKALNGYAALNQIAAEYRRQYGYPIETDYLSSGLDNLANKNLVQKMTTGYYKLLPEGQKFLATQSFSSPPPEKSKDNPKASTSSNNNLGTTINRLVIGTTSRKSPSDISCPFCKLYYPQGTITCSKCNATIGSLNQVKKERLEDPPKEQHKAHTRQAKDQRSPVFPDRVVGIGEIIFAILGALSGIGAASWLSYTHNASPSFSDASSSSTPSSSQLTGDLFFTTSEGGIFGPTITSGATPFLGTTTSAGSEGTEGPDIPIWEDSWGNWHIGDSVPYSVVEKRAEQVYGAIHRDELDKVRFPLVVAQTPEHAEIINKVFKGQRADIAEEKLDLWISLLEHSDHVS